MLLHATVNTRRLLNISYLQDKWNWLYIVTKQSFVIWHPTRLQCYCHQQALNHSCYYYQSPLVMICDKTLHCEVFVSHDFHWNGQVNGVSMRRVKNVQTTSSLPMVTLMWRVYHSLAKTKTKHREFPAASRDSRVTEEKLLQRVSVCRQL